MHSSRRHRIWAGTVRVCTALLVCNAALAAGAASSVAPATATPAPTVTVTPTATVAEGMSTPVPDPGSATSGPLAIANLPTDESMYQRGRTTQCITMREIRGHQVLDDRNIVFELPRGRYVLSQMQQRCEFLSQRDTISLESRMGGSQLCALDRVNVLESNVGFGRIGAAETIGGFRVLGRCFLGPFEQITKEQLAGLRDAMKARRRDERGFWDWITGG